MLQIHTLVHANTILLKEAVCRMITAQDSSSHRGTLASLFIDIDHMAGSNLRIFYVFLH